MYYLAVNNGEGWDLHPCKDKFELEAVFWKKIGENSGREYKVFKEVEFNITIKETI
jgi:hypothetical protein